MSARTGRARTMVSRKGARGTARSPDLPAGDGGTPSSTAVSAAVVGAVLALAASSPVSAQTHPAASSLAVRARSPVPPAVWLVPPAPAPAIADSPGAPALPSSPSETTRAASDNGLTLLLAGVGSAAAGSFGGAFLGYRLDRAYFHWDCENGCEDPGLLGLLGGWLVGSALTTPLGVHLANDRRGPLGLSYAASALIGGTALAGLAVGAAEFVFLAAPVLQVASAVTIEFDAAR